MTTNGFGGVSGRSGREAVISRGYSKLGPLQLTSRGVVMELSINLTINCSGLEAGVGGAKSYRGCHRSRAVLRRGTVLPAVESLDVFP
jgi:hypothetical protein